MEDSGGLDCSVCCKVAHYAVQTPCCSSLACRTCAISNLIKFQGRCGLQNCDKEDVLIDDLAPHQEVRRRVEEKEVWKHVVTNLPYIEPNIVQRTIDYRNHYKRLKVDENWNILLDKMSDGKRKNVTSNWRVIFVDCETIFDGTHSQFTQIGCYAFQVSNRRKSSLFLSMYPTKIGDYLLLKQKSDVLDTLHMVWNTKTGFQFVQTDREVVKALPESDGLEDFLSFLGEEDANALFLNSANCVFPLLLKKINLERLEKNIAGICELKTFLGDSLGAENPHTEDIYERVMRKPFEVSTPTCAQTAKCMFQLVETVHNQRGNRYIDFKSFISKFFKTISYFKEKFSNFGTDVSENTNEDKIILQIESSFRPGFVTSVEMCRVEVIDLADISDETPQGTDKTFQNDNFELNLPVPVPARKEIPSPSVNYDLPVPVPAIKGLDILSKSKSEVTTTFILSVAKGNKTVDSVSVVGTFTSWSAIPLNFENGRWEVGLKVNPGWHQYNFIVEGVWIHDDTRYSTVNRQGTRNNHLFIFRGARGSEVSSSFLKKIISGKHLTNKQTNRDSHILQRHSCEIKHEQLSIKTIKDNKRELEIDFKKEPVTRTKKENVIDEEEEDYTKSFTKVSLKRKK